LLYYYYYYNGQFVRRNRAHSQHKEAQTGL
jgi:hypothetical protein